MNKTVHIHIKLLEDTANVFDAFSRNRGISRTTFLEEMLFILKANNQDPKKMKDFFGDLFYEKYFK